VTTPPGATRPSRANTGAEPGHQRPRTLARLGRRAAAATHGFAVEHGPAVHSLYGGFCPPWRRTTAGPPGARASVAVCVSVRLSLCTGFPCGVLAQGPRRRGARTLPATSCCALDRSALRHNCTPPQLPLPDARTLRAGWTRHTLVSSMTSSPSWRRSLRAEICSSRLRRRASDY
jgi:hypothetical protein